MFGDVVLGVPHEDFEHCLANLKKERGVKFDIELTGEDLRGLITQYKEVYKRHNHVLPEDPWEQLRMGVDAVFRCVQVHVWYLCLHVPLVLHLFCT